MRRSGRFESSDWAKARIKSAEAHANFIRWATREGFREYTLPARNGFIQRLRANCPSIEPRHAREGNFLTGSVSPTRKAKPTRLTSFPGSPHEGEVKTKKPGLA